MIDTIILAAGANQRLQPLIPATFKPLLFINGETLISQCVRRAREACGDAIVVCAPSNVAPIVEIAEHHRPFCMPKYVVQPKPEGTFDAIARAMPYVTSDLVCILMADNIIPDGLVTEMARLNQEAVATMCSDKKDEISRFTWFKDGRWHDKEVPQWDDIPAHCWIGPLILESHVLRQMTQGSGVVSWADILPQDINRVPSTCSDVGVPEALQ